MRPAILAVLLAASIPAVALAQTEKPHEAAVSAAVQKALADPARQTDRAEDTRRQVAQVMAFAEVKPGQKVLELVPGSGYWTRVFSAVVGPQGHVYTVWPHEMGKYSAKSFANWQGLVATPHYANVSLLQQPAALLSAAEPIDLVFTAQNYHDYHDPFMGPVDMAGFDKRVYDALKPGGLFVVIDHMAPAGSGLADTDTLHRIDPAVVKQEVEAAGFVFDGESDALRNPADPLNAKVFDKSIRGHTDQFVYRFRKPAK
ncbi:MULTISPECIES: class I SAM-dependent methyltransferase [Rhodanobacter]|uniref:class I SAM-dependent methyltransferase n=1 Tax=Rhodanobacter TaxID=75309 RepID=UPI000422B99F|nr:MULTISPECIES: class I SAM-dependent methyltransferase [Rhodanobacter]TAN19251.1 MAG: methyltransferase [Rhodanobacter sp.]UJJ53854.1 class I SAM-dependent methyltransferase [Rhodanobacter thiooxydans]